MKRFLRDGVAVLLGSLAGVLFAETPQWWVERGIIDTNASPNDYAPVNQGQVKNMAVQAREEFNAALPFGSGSNINQLVESFTTNLNYAPANIGQLKAVARPFYDRLNMLSITNAWPAGMVVGPYPWSGLTNAPQDYAIANIGQLKYLFSFTATNVGADADADGLPDWWEHLYFGNTSASPTDDPDGDGLTNIREFTAGTNPCTADTDEDGMSDYAEAALQESVGSNGTGALLITVLGRGFYHVTEPGLELIFLGE